MTDFLLHLQANNYSPKTIQSYRRDLMAVFSYAKTINKKNIERYKQHLTAKNISPITINRHLSSVRSYLSYLIETDQPAPMPPGAVKLVRVPTKQHTPPNRHDIILLIEAPSILEPNPRISRRNRAALEVLFATGMRISELTNIERGDFVATDTLLVRGKGNKQRFAYLTPRAKEYLSIYLLEVDTDRLFPVTSNYLQQKIKEYREALQLSRVTAHTLRHGFATLLAENGANPAAIQHLLGHSSLHTTTRYVNPSDQFAAQSHTKYFTY